MGCKDHAFIPLSNEELCIEVKGLHDHLSYDLHKIKPTQLVNSKTLLETASCVQDINNYTIKRNR
jgi:hypothetical protein